MQIRSKHGSCFSLLCDGLVHVACMLLDEATVLEKAVPADKLRTMLQTQLEYYFSA